MPLQQAPGYEADAGRATQASKKKAGLWAAVGAWRVAWQMEPENADAKALVEFGQKRLAGDPVQTPPPLRLGIRSRASKATLVSGIPVLLASGTKTGDVEPE